MEKTTEELFFEAFHGMGRLGPGSETSTGKAIALVGRIGRGGDAPQILDVGCGNGVQTLLLAEAYPAATITAVDNHQPFLDNLSHEAERRGCAERITTVCTSMTELDFPEGTFDLIWSEGAIYIIGFQRGITEWRRLLAPGGVLACSEVCWLTDSSAVEAAAFWQREYPEITGIGPRLEQISAAGYSGVEHFGLPGSDWQGYYDSIQANLERMASEYGNNPNAAEVISELQEEIDIFRRYGEQYGYVFFVMQM